MGVANGQGLKSRSSIEESDGRSEEEAAPATMAFLEFKQEIPVTGQASAVIRRKWVLVNLA